MGHGYSVVSSGLLDCLDWRYLVPQRREIRIDKPLTKLLTITAVSASLFLVACSQAPEGVAIHDPYEATNRKVHEFNVGLDRAILRPASRVTAAMPMEITGPVTNFAENIALPGMMVNGVLQGDIKGFGTNSMRFIVNTIFGIGGLFDPADAIGLYEEKTDFGETLSVWGVPEGAYVELPALGPSTERDAVGELVDFFINPLGNWVHDDVKPYLPAARAADIVIARGQLGSTIDSVLYESADSYAQTRIIYLDNRRYELGTVVQDAYIDPYADPYFDPYEDQ